MAADSVFNQWQNDASAQSAVTSELVLPASRAIARRGSPVMRVNEDATITSGKRQRHDV